MRENNRIVNESIFYRGAGADGDIGADGAVFQETIFTNKGRANDFDIILNGYARINMHIALKRGFLYFAMQFKVLRRKLVEQKLVGGDEVFGLAGIFPPAGN